MQGPIPGKSLLPKAWSMKLGLSTKRIWIVLTSTCRTRTTDSCISNSSVALCVRVIGSLVMHGATEACLVHPTDNIDCHNLLPVAMISHRNEASCLTSWAPSNRKKLSELFAYCATLSRIEKRNQKGNENGRPPNPPKTQWWRDVLPTQKPQLRIGCVDMSCDN